MGFHIIGAYVTFVSNNLWGANHSSIYNFPNLLLAFLLVVATSFQSAMLNFYLGVNIGFICDDVT